ncbi:MAG TPA: NapC/NirT family cytochrome c [Symbiobacteriaceae bacterium]|nr:NapC/NirT family cytochrome c [Symbiobacteriaceae bacterium]
MPTWGLRLLVTAGGLFGLFLLVAALLQVPAVGKAMGSNEACGTCHLMTPEIDSKTRSAHRDLSCLDCHSPHGFWAKPIDEAKVSARHVYVTLTHTEPDVVKLTESGFKTVEANCRDCHASLFENLHGGAPARNCTDCHRATPHDRPTRVGQ